MYNTYKVPTHFTYIYCIICMLREINSKPKCVFLNIKYNVNTTRCHWFYDLARYGTAKPWVRIILTVLSGHRWSSFCGVSIGCLYTHIIYLYTQERKPPTKLLWRNTLCLGNGTKMAENVYIYMIICV